MDLYALMEALRTRVAPPGETGVQRISWSFGQVALANPDANRERLRAMAEQAVCARYEEEIESLRSQLATLRNSADHNAREIKAAWWRHREGRETAEETIAAMERHAISILIALEKVEVKP